MNNINLNSLSIVIPTLGGKSLLTVIKLLNDGEYDSYDDIEETPKSSSEVESITEDESEQFKTMTAENMESARER